MRGGDYDQARRANDGAGTHLQTDLEGMVLTISHPPMGLRHCMIPESDAFSMVAYTMSLWGCPQGPSGAFPSGFCLCEHRDHDSQEVSLVCRGISM